MSEFSHRDVEANGITLHVAEAGVGKPVVFVHGFPELWRSWRHQMPALADAGFRAVAPDMRGFGRTTQPPDVSDYDIEHTTGDLCGLLDDLGVDKAAFVGHDWGAAVVWRLALRHPDRVEALVNLSVPFTPRSRKPPTERMKEIFGDSFFYMLYFQKVGPAEEELSRDVRTTLRRFAWSVSGEATSDALRAMPKDGTGFLDTLSDPPGEMEWFRDEDLDYFIGEFERTGFFGGLNYYRNIDRNWELWAPYADAKVTPPCLFLAGEKDPVIRMSPPDAMDGWVPNLKGKVLIPRAGHWVQWERPAEVNAAILGFLKDVGY